MPRAPMGLRYLLLFVAAAHPALEQISTDLKKVLTEITRVGQRQQTELNNTERWFVTERQLSGKALTHIGQEIEALKQDLYQTEARRAAATREAEVLQRRLSSLAEQITEIGDQREQEFRDAENRHLLQLTEWRRVTPPGQWSRAPQLRIPTPPQPQAETTSFTPSPPEIHSIPLKPEVVSAPPIGTAPFPPVETVLSPPLPPPESAPFSPGGTAPLPPIGKAPLPPAEPSPTTSAGSSEAHAVTAIPAKATETESAANVQYQESLRPLSDEFISVSAQREAKYNRITEMSVRIQGLEQHLRNANGRLGDVNQHIASVTSRHQEIVLSLQKNEARRKAEFRMLDNLMNLLVRPDLQSPPEGIPPEVMMLQENMRSKFYRNHVFLQFGDQDTPFGTFDVSGELNRLLDQLEETHYNWCQEHQNAFVEEFDASKRRLRDARRIQKEHIAIEQERIADIKRLKDQFIDLQRQMQNLNEEEKLKRKELEEKVVDVSDAIRKLEDISVVLKRLYDQILLQEEVHPVTLLHRGDNQLDERTRPRSPEKRRRKRGRRSRRHRKRRHPRRKERPTTVVPPFQGNNSPPVTTETSTVAPEPAAVTGVPQVYDSSPRAPTTETSAPAPEPGAVTEVPTLHGNKPLAPTIETEPVPPRKIVENVSPISPFSHGRPALPPVPPEYIPIGTGLRHEVQNLHQALAEERASLSPEKERVTREIQARRQRLQGEMRRTEEERETMKRTIREEVERLRYATKNLKDSFDASFQNLRRFELSCSNILRDFHAQRQ